MCHSEIWRSVLCGYRATVRGCPATPVVWTAACGRSGVGAAGCHGSTSTPDARCTWHDSVAGHGRAAGHGRVTERRPGGRGAGTPREAYGSGATVALQEGTCDKTPFALPAGYTFPF